VGLIEDSFTRTISTAGKPKSNVKKGFKEALATQDLFAKASYDFLKRMGIDGLGSENGLMFLNGKLLEFSEEKV
jgi:hypothetical protein